jgi:hypothetical protein
VIKKKFGKSPQQDGPGAHQSRPSWPFTSVQWHHRQWHWDGRGDSAPGRPTQGCSRVLGRQEGRARAWRKDHQGMFPPTLNSQKKKKN